MDRQQKLRTYDNIIAVVVMAIIAAMLLASCTTQRGAGYQDHLRSTPSQNFVRHDNGGCGWSR